MVLASIAGGLTTSKLGFYTPPAILGSCIMAAGAGLLTTLSASTPSSAWIGYQALYGLGMGLSFQAPNLAAQTVLPARDVPVGTALVFFAQLLGAAGRAAGGPARDGARGVQRGAAERVSDRVGVGVSGGAGDGGVGVAERFGEEGGESWREEWCGG